jgi:hypothetical protein
VDRRLRRALAAWNAGDYGVALDIWAPLAQAGHARAQSNMGAACLAGRGVERDVVEALHWLLRGEASGAGELAVGFLHEARAHAKPSQRAEADRRAAQPLP